MIDLEIGGLVFPIDSKHSIEQSYEDVTAQTTHRMMDGTARRQQRWTKLKTTISGSGWVPAGISALDKSQSHLIKCLGERSIIGASPITIPGGYRTDGDYAPRGFGYVAGEMVETAVADASGVITLTAVTGATAYQVIYYPEITAYITSYDDNFSLDSAEFGWSIECEEV